MQKGDDPGAQGPIRWSYLQLRSGVIFSFSFQKKQIGKILSDFLFRQQKVEDSCALEGGNAECISVIFPRSGVVHIELQPPLCYTLE